MNQSNPACRNRDEHVCQLEHRSRMGNGTPKVNQDLE